MPKLVVCKWVWYQLTAPENSSHSGHMHFPGGFSQAASGYIYDSPSSQPPPPMPPAPTPVISTTWTRAYVVAATFQKTLSWWQHFIREASVGGSRHQDMSYKGLMLERWSPGWLNGFRGAQEKSVTFWVGMCGRLLEKRKSMMFLSQV